MDRDIKFEKAIGNKVKELREALDWSQEYLASIANTEKKQIQRVEAAEYSFSMRTVTGIAKALGRQPWEVLKVDYEVKVNTDLRPQPRRSPGATFVINKLVKTTFFNSPRAVRDVVRECAVRYESTLRSSAVSGVLRNLVEQKQLEDIHARIKGRYLYQKPKKK